MGHAMPAKHAEIDRNFDRFMDLLPSLMKEHADQYVLMRGTEVIDFFGSALDAQIAGNQKFSDEIFSIQHIKQSPEDLGFMSHALYTRPA